MKKVLHLSLVSLLLTFTLWGCKEKIDEASAEKQFVWNAMNYWYYWQMDVPELADKQAFFKNEQDFQDYLRGYSDAEALYDDLIYEPRDDFSFFIDDYDEFLQRRQGNFQGFGFEYGLVRPDSQQADLFGYVQYVLNGFPADIAGIERGDIFTGINGVELTINNYQNLLADETYDLTMAESVDGEISETGEFITVNSTTVTENPIYLSKVIDTGSAKVGYLMYNSFQTNSHENLNDVFDNFISQGIDELVLDLRYNGGGAVITSATLATMISGLDGSDQYAIYTFNSKRSGQNNSIVPFQDQLRVYNEEGSQIDQVPINKLSNLDRLFVLTGFGTASASEAVINGLRPYLNDVILIGRQTVGKDDASLTLYDAPAPYTDRTEANPDHEQAIQPIVLKVKNDAGESDGDGFVPVGDNFIREISFLLQTGHLPPLGDESDPLLARALELVSGQPVAKALAQPPPFRGEIFKDSRDLEQFGKDMYLLPER